MTLSILNLKKITIKKYRMFDGDTVIRCIEHPILIDQQ